MDKLRDWFLSLLAGDEMDNALGLDLNHWRPGLDLKLAKQNGARFIFAKATEGISFVDSAFSYYKSQAKAKYLPFGAYHYWLARYDPEAQARHFLNIAGPDTELLPVLDVEKYNNQGVLSQSAAEDHIAETLRWIQLLFQRDVMIYTNRDSWTVLTGDSPVIANFPLWAANWTTANAPTLPIGAVDWTFWQFTNDFPIPGAPNEGYDANYFNGNEGAFEAYVASLGTSPPSGDCCEELKIVVDENGVRITAVEEKQVIAADLISGLADLHAADVNSLDARLVDQAEDTASLEARIAILEDKLKEIKNIL